MVARSDIDIAERLRHIGHELIEIGVVLDQRALRRSRSAETARERRARAPATGEEPLDATAAPRVPEADEIDRQLLKFVAQRTQQGEPVGTKKNAINYAPRLLRDQAREYHGVVVGLADLEESMERLLNLGRLKIVPRRTHDGKSRQYLEVPDD